MTRVFLLRKAYPNSLPHLNSTVRNRTVSAMFPTSPPLNMQSKSHEANKGKVRPAPIQAVCDSPNASDYDDADGITLSPTFSEVSGLTIPACLDAEDGSKTTLQTDGFTLQSDVFDNLSKASLFDKTISPIARHRQKKQEDKSDLSSTLTTGATISKHPYLKRMNTKLSQASSGESSRNNHADSTDRIHEMPTPRAKGGLNQASKMFSRREQIVRRVRASPRHRNFPQHLTYNGTAKFSSQEWQERNVIAEHQIPQPSSSDNTLSLRRFDDFGFPSAKPKGRVAERVTQVNKKMKNDQKQSNKNTKRTMGHSSDRPRNYSNPRNGNHGDSDCIRTIRID